MANISELATKLDSPPPEARIAQQAILTEVWHSGAKDQQKKRAELGEQLTAELAGKHKPTANIKLAEYASLTAGDKQVDSLLNVAQTSKEAHTAHMACWALDRLPGEASTAALVKLAGAGKSVDMCVAAINALGQRVGSNAGKGVVDTLKKCAAEKEVEVALAAGEALANHAEAALDATIAGIKAESDRAKLRVAKARIRLGEGLVKAGKKDDAKKILQAVIDGDAEPAQKKVAKKLLG